MNSATPTFTVGSLSRDGKRQPLASGVQARPSIDLTIISAEPAIAILCQANVPLVTDWHFQSRDSDPTAQRDLYIKSSFNLLYMLVFLSKIGSLCHFSKPQKYSKYIPSITLLFIFNRLVLGSRTLSVTTKQCLLTGKAAVTKFTLQSY